VKKSGTDRSTFTVVSLWGKFGGLNTCAATFSDLVSLPNIFLIRLFSKLRLKEKDFQEKLRLPWAHRTRLQQLLLLLLTNNVSNKSGNLLFAQSYPEQYENVGFVHSWCTVPTEILQSEPLVETKMCITASFEDAPISLRRTSSSPPLTFCGILVGTLFRSLRANDSLAPSVVDTRCSTPQ
jgi:hypothetical protein